MDSERLLDDAGLEILRALQQNARISFAELSRKVRMSAPGITERVRKMEEAGIILGYHARLDPSKTGYPVSAFLRLRAQQDQFPEIIRLARDTAEVRECHHASGDDAFLLKVVAHSEDEVARVAADFSPFAEVRISVIVSTPVEKSAP
jgi:Lrp/AsnC family transcriptional regulator, leucine-responsive regulatory protein